MVVGAESTGLTAAIVLADDPKLKVALVTKGEGIGKAGATMLAHEPLSSCVLDSKSASEILMLKRGDPKDSPEAFFEDIVVAGDYMSDQRLVEVVVNKSCPVAKEITDWGFEWNKDVVDRSSGHRFPRDYYGVRAWGPQFLRLGASLVREKHVEIFTDTIIIDLLTSNNRIAGVTAVDLHTGEFFVIRCKVVILAAGGCQNVYEHVTTGRDLTGDAYAMAFRAGAHLMDMEFVKFMISIVWPEGAAHDPFALLQAFRHTAHWFNRFGQRFMEKWDPENMERNREVGKIAIATEILEGRGGKHGIYHSIKHLPTNLIDYQSEWSRLKGWKDLATHYDYTPYVELMKNGGALEVSLSCHYNEGGIKIDEDCMTEIPGLYAAGEASAGVDGGRRIAGMALTAAFVQGYVAAKSAARYVTKCDWDEVNWNQVQSSERRVFRAAENKNGDISPVEIRKQIQKLAEKTIWVVRNENSMKFALEESKRIRDSLERMRLASTGLDFNPEFLESLQVENLLDCFEIIASASLTRKESRGVHYRSDYPMMDNDTWLKNILISKGPNNTISITTSPVVVTRLELPRGVQKYGEYITRIDSYKSS